MLRRYTIIIQNMSNTYLLSYKDKYVSIMITKITKLLKLQYLDRISDDVLNSSLLYSIHFDRYRKFVDTFIRYVSFKFNNKS